MDPMAISAAFGAGALSAITQHITVLHQNQNQTLCIQFKTHTHIQLRLIKYIHIPTLKKSKRVPQIKQKLLTFIRKNQKPSPKYN